MLIAIVLFEVAGVADGVVERLRAVVEAVGDALSQQIAEAALQAGLEVGADAVAAKGQRQARVGLPPGAEIDHGVEAFVAVGELAFVDHHAGVDLSPLHHRQDLVERHPDRLEVAQPEAGREVRGG